MITVKVPHEVGFVAPTPDNSFWFITKYGLELYHMELTGEYDKVADAPNRMYMTFAFKFPRFFAPIAIRPSKNIERVYTFDSGMFDPEIECLEDVTDYSSGDELWPCPGPDEEHQEDPPWAIAWTLEGRKSSIPAIDTASVLRAACSWPLLVWRRNLGLFAQCVDPFSSIAPPGVVSTISRSSGIVFSNLSTDRSVVISGPESLDQVCLSSRGDFALCVSGREIFIVENPLFSSQ